MKFDDLTIALDFFTCKYSVYKKDFDSRSDDKEFIQDILLKATVIEAYEDMDIEVLTYEVLSLIKLIERI